MANPHDDLFNYTSGRWVFNDALRHAQRRLIFDVEELCRLAAQSVGRSPADVVHLSKLAEGGFNRTFLITLCDDLQMVARIPYPTTLPKYYAVASEVATMEFLRSSRLPVPQVYGYSPVSDNTAKTEYIFMRDGYQYQEQSPSAHVENLKRYLLIASSLVPRDPVLGRFCIRHPDLQQSNIVVRRSSDSGWQVVGLLDWQHASILPLFLLAGVPERLQNYDDPVSQSMTPPSLPENFELDETEQTEAEGAYRCRLDHYHYIKNTEEYNKPHYDVLMDSMCALRSRLFDQAGSPWEGDALDLKVALIRATERWETLTGLGAPCPVIFDADDVRETRKLNELQEKTDRAFEVWQNIFGLGPDGWVPTQHYEEAVALCKQAKEEAVTEATSQEERAEIMAHWPWDDMDEGKYM
ncbi:hypothetical protein IEO21_02050 [Rhodonia placenta]|uniref:Aminoglycoside phosphotransferase domain-containing protein n=1 Tax=Rhodonia placenta TaxID=104341 RepID=A0A8H7U4S6_9APHY|nr:hypothetical protein IEO21_02050 [Postia placenta]